MGAMSNKPFTAPAEKKEETAVTASPVSVHSAPAASAVGESGRSLMTMATGMPSSRSLTKSADRIQNSIPMAGARVFCSPVSCDFAVWQRGEVVFLLAIGPRGRYNESYGTGPSRSVHGKGILSPSWIYPTDQLGQRRSVICAVSSDPWSRKRMNETMQAAHRA